MDKEPQQKNQERMNEDLTLSFRYSTLISKKVKSKDIIAKIKTKMK